MCHVFIVGRNQSNSEISLMKLANFVIIYIYAARVSVCTYVLQSHNQILIAAATGDVAALRRVARETDPVLVAAVENKVQIYYARIIFC